MAATTALKPRQLIDLLAVSFKINNPVLITGAPGIGKSDLVAAAAKQAGADVIISHPVVSDPTDAKGLPWPSKDGDHATFLPFGELAQAIRATKPTVWFLDDLGQAPPAVQASYMQLLLARRVNGHALPDCVTFVAATNRRSDRAGVSGILEPVKSRFGTIVELEPNLQDWCDWAVSNNVAPEVIAFLRFKPNLLSEFKATADLTNSPSPRTWARISQWIGGGLPKELEYPTFVGAVGEGAAGEFCTFIKIARDLPSLDAILLDPDSVPVPKEISALYAVSSGLAARSNANNFDRVARYIERMAEAGKAEFGVFTLRDSFRRDPSISNTKGWIKLSTTRVGDLLAGEVK